MAAFSYWETELMARNEQEEEKEKRKRPTPNIRHASSSRRKPASIFAAAAIDPFVTAAPPQEEEEEEEEKEENVAAIATASHDAGAAPIQENVGTTTAPDSLPAAPNPDSKRRKRITSACCKRRKVEKCSLDPADPNVIPAKLTMKDLIRLAEAKEKLKESATKKPREGKENGGINNIENTDQSQEKEGAAFAPQVQIVNGQIVINQDSLTVPSRSISDIDTFKRVEETHSKLNYHSYVKRTPRVKWTADDTKNFYKALEQFGTNFELIQALFPGKTRRQIVLKFKNEEKKNPLLLADAMTHRPEDYVHYEEFISRLNLTMGMPEPGSSFYSASDIDMALQNSDHAAPVLEKPEVNNEFYVEVQDFEAEKLQESTYLKEEIPAEASTLLDVKCASSDRALSIDALVMSSENELDKSFKSESHHSEPPSTSEPVKPQRSKCLFGYQLS